MLGRLGARRVVGINWHCARRSLDYHSPPLAHRLAAGWRDRRLFGSQSATSPHSEFAYTVLIEYSIDSRTAVSYLELFRY